jgi:hypothetical protein
MDEDEDGTRVECITGECITGELEVVGGGNELMRACFAAEEAVGVRTRENMSEADQLWLSGLSGALWSEARCKVGWRLIDRLRAGHYVSESHPFPLTTGHWCCFGNG